MKHHILAIRHFGTECHTAGNIAQTVQKILSEYETDASNVTATTNHGTNVVSPFVWAYLILLRVLTAWHIGCTLVLQQYGLAHALHSLNC